MNEPLRAAAREAAQRFGTPLYLYDSDRLRAAAAAIVEAFPDPWLRLYALKANGLPALVRRIGRAGFMASAVSAGEVALARRAGLAPARIVLEGIGKTDADLALAAELDAGGTPLAWVSLESAEDAAALAAAAAAAADGPSIDVLVRINPGVAPETHAGLAVGAAQSKFGVLPEELAAVITAGGGPAGPLRWRGIHLHIGSQLGAIDAWRAAARIGLRLIALQRAELPGFDTINFGGGFPVAYGAAADEVPAPAHFAAAIRAELDDLAANAQPARLVVEPGRALVADAGWLIGRVLHMREREQPIVVIDAGMTELIRPALYGALHPAHALTSLGQPLANDTAETTTVRLDGPICESTDSFGLARLPPLERGDLVAIGSVGAYGSAMASSYNGRPRPPEIGWDGRRLTLWRGRGSPRSLP